jgi:hypothetical protein
LLVLTALLQARHPSMQAHACPCTHARPHAGFLTMRGRQAERPANIDARNADGVSVQELAERAMQAQEDAQCAPRMHVSPCMRRAIKPRQCRTL